MSHFAEVNPDTNTVIRVIVAEQDFINSGSVGPANRWIQTSYNTRGGKHYEPNSNLTIEDKMTSDTYFSGFAGSGWNIDFGKSTSGKSTAELAVSTLATTNTLNLRVVGFEDSPSNSDATAAGRLCVVMLNNHFYRYNANGTGAGI